MVGSRFRTIVRDRLPADPFCLPDGRTHADEDTHDGLELAIANTDDVPAVPRESFERGPYEARVYLSPPHHYLRIDEASSIESTVLCSWRYRDDHSPSVSRHRTASNASKATNFFSVG